MRTGHIEIPEGHVWIHVGTINEVHGGRPYEFAACASFDASAWKIMKQADREAWKARKLADLKYEAEQEYVATPDYTPRADKLDDPYGKVAERMGKLAGLD
jgi:hypothetical protein